ncbi:MAG: hypothetical protein Q9M13_08405, partial [Mariprofundales bacterium]|nr:hypothetical protein [Mariprofundales bacterium]
MSYKKSGFSLQMATLLLGFIGCAAVNVGAASVEKSAVVDQQGLTVVEQSALKSAIEDYQFQELAKAIATLERLRQKHPTNLNVLHYIALSYEESSRYSEAQGAYAQWLRYSGNRMDKDARFAWIGMAKAYDKTKHTAMGVKLLRIWLEKHPDDYDASVVLGDMLVREKNYDGTKSLFQNMLTKKDVPDN